MAKYKAKAKAKVQAGESIRGLDAGSDLKSGVRPVKVRGGECQFSSFFFVS